NKLVTSRKKELEHFKEEELPQRFAELKGEYFPVPQTRVAPVEGAIQGMGCCSGSVSGKFIVVDEHTDLSQDFSGYIVIAKFFEPGWINIYTQASGIIAERGNLLSHASIIARELNLPAIVGAKGIIEGIKNSQSINMNGTTGIVYLKDE
ncbi:PEP-utilizing enzyme, partial [Lishizhenia sp.]|uniref:PEP-utilizing enzyme n=1 Tax=Lishizhenia sp. TaxID=2497594 RepID=UPI00299ECEC6